ncbi:permease [Veillonella sp. AS16]|uniref:permease n=1 Tax=Veillonella sp. AS16 TaxID=936589 RepID=UPI0003E2C7AB|nr:permease [Veillonella sp. AS16]ETS91597.1 putative permease [Veillonella sp. AS16]
MIPVYIVMGFIGSGKSTLINEQLQHRKKLGGTALISAEEGSTKLIKEPLVLEPDRLSVINPFQQKSYIDISKTIATYLDKVQPKELWIEWNGMLGFHQLEALLYSKELRDKVRIEKVLYLCSDAFISTMLPALGANAESQLYSADIIITESDQHDDLLHSYNPDAHIIIRPTAKDVERLCRKNTWGLIPNLLIMALTAYILIVTVFRHDVPYSVHQCFAIITGLIIEAIPFLLLGTIAATGIRFFVPQRILLKLLGGHSWKSYGTAMMSGLVLPVCDCAIIPLFKALIDRGVPLSVAILFMLASPIINPITILSTWYAFPDNPMITVWRILLGLGVALIVALSFRYRPPALSELKGSKQNGQNFIYEALSLSFAPSGIQETVHNDNTGTTIKKHSLTKRIFRQSAVSPKILLLHMEREFTQLLLYFSIAAAIVAVFQVYGKPLLLSAGITLPDIATIPVLLLAAFLFSVCSTSDAIIGKTLSGLFPLGAVMGFLILGPMMDIKNVYLLRQYVPAAFIWRLALTLVITTGLTALLFLKLIQ